MDLQLAASRDAIPAGRRWITQCLREHGAPERTCSTVALLTSELVTNAVKYGPGDGEILLSVGCRAAHLDVAVRDESDDVPVERRAGPTAVGGRGLRLVDQLADDWGVQVHPRHGKSVWFRIGLRTAGPATQ